MILANGVVVNNAGREGILLNILNEIDSLYNMTHVYIAADQNGRIYVFTREPHNTGKQWRCAKRLRNNRGFMWICSGDVIAEWETSLTEISIEDFRKIAITEGL